MGVGPNFEVFIKPFLGAVTSLQFEILGHWSSEVLALLPCIQALVSPFTLFMQNVYVPLHVHKP